MNTLRGYGQMNIGGALRPFHVGTNQTAIFCDLRKMDLADYNEMFASLLPTIGEGGEIAAPKRRMLSASENRDFIYSALAAGAQNERQLVAFAPEEVGNWLDDDDEDGAEAAKPLLMHIELMKQRIERRAERLLGNVPAPSQAGPKSRAKSRK